jgi:type I restriction enzyme S subunit
VSAATPAAETRVVRGPTPAFDALRVLPDEWRCERLKYHTWLNPETLSEATPADQRISYIDISAVDRNGQIAPPAELPFGEAPSRARRVVRTGDTIVSTVRTYLRAVAHIHPEMDGYICSTGFAVLRAKPSLDPRFLHYWASATPFIEDVVARSVGVSYPAITSSRVLEIHAPVPPMDEQVAIGQYLDEQVDQLERIRLKKSELLRVVRERRRGVIDAELRALDVAPEWESVRFKHVLDEVEQGWSPECENRRAEDDEWGVLKVGCVNGIAFDETQNKALPVDMTPREQLEVRAGDVLMSRANTRELLGSAARVPEGIRPRLLLSDKLYRLHLDRARVDARYVVMALESSLSRYQLERAATGASASMQNISQTTVRDVRIPVPSLEEQRRVVARVEEAARMTAAIAAKTRAHLELLDEFRRSLVAAAVTGRIEID